MISISTQVMFPMVVNPFIERFNEGGPFFMSLILICLLLTIFFIVKTAIALKKNDFSFNKYLSLIGESGLLGLVVGVLGSVIGMIGAFDAIEGLDAPASPALIAGGLKVSFLTAVFGSFTFIVSRVGIIALKWMNRSITKTN